MNGGEIQLKSQRGIVWKRPTQKDASPEAIRAGAALGTDEPTLLGFFEPQQRQTYLEWQ